VNWNEPDRVFVGLEVRRLAGQEVSALARLRVLDQRQEDLDLFPYEQRVGGQLTGLVQPEHLAIGHRADRDQQHARQQETEESELSLGPGLHA
jgi:hypothetical protein